MKTFERPIFLTLLLIVSLLTIGLSIVLLIPNFVLQMIVKLGNKLDKELKKLNENTNEK